MLTKLLIASVVFLEILKIPNAEDKVTSLSWAIFKKPLIIQQEQGINHNKVNIDEGEFSIDKIEMPPIRKRNVKEPYVAAEGVLVMDMETSKILYQKNLNKKYPLASLTKIMTAIIALENYREDDVLVVPEEGTHLIGAKINLIPGERITVRSLLYGLLLYSGNDAAYTLASKIGIEAFVSKMNAKAKELGLNDFRFVDPAGLQVNNIGSLRDLAFLAKYALQNSKFAQIVQTNEFEIFSVDKMIKHPLRNTNRLLREYPGTFGVKTGYTQEAGHCLISAVERNGHSVLAIVLNHPGDQFKESTRLFDWVFNAYTWE